jgi:heme exporter protein A
VLKRSNPAIAGFFIDLRQYLDFAGAHDPAHMLCVSELSCSRGDRRLFSGVNLTLSQGHCVHIEGDNGVGKTSLLRIVSGLSPAAGGQVAWAGEPIQASEAYRAARMYLGHALALKEDLSALENLQFDAAIAGRPLSVLDASAALVQLGLRGREHLPVRVLSQGQKRRAALARLLASRAALWILDEPLVALDLPAQTQVCQILQTHLDAGGMALVTSHQPLQVSGAHCSKYRLQA